MEKEWGVQRYNLIENLFKYFFIFTFQSKITRVANDGLKYVNKRNDFWKEIPNIKHDHKENQ